MKNKITLTGFMGAGKSTVGEALAKKLSIQFYDTDRLLEEKYKTDNVFDLIGEQEFRIQENEILKILLNMKKPCVISLGGGAFAGDNIEFINSKSVSVYVIIDIKTAWERCHSDNRPRPLICNGLDFFKQRYLMRVGGYQMAHVIVDNPEPKHEYDVPVIKAVNSILSQIKHLPELCDKYDTITKKLQ